MKLAAWPKSLKAFLKLTRSYVKQWMLLTVFLTQTSSCATVPNPIDNDGEIAGQVTDSNGAPLKGVMVTATHIDTGFGDVDFTLSDGSYRIGGLQKGEYALAIGGPGYRYETNNVELGVPTTVVPTVSMKRELGADNFDVLRPNNFSVVDIYYGTDRARVKKSQTGYGYTGARGDSFEYGVMEVAIPRDHRLGKFESPKIWRLEFRPDPKKHITLLSVSPGDRSLMEASLAATDSALVFVHGYNTSFEEAARRSAQLYYDLKFNGTPILYSWPSTGEVLNYLEDLGNAGRSGVKFEKFISNLLDHSTIVNIIAHSMGNEVLLRGLERLTNRGNDSNPLINEIILVAPDVDAEVFEETASDIRPLGKRISLYVSSNDKALNLSKRLRGGYLRLGDMDNILGPIVMPDIDTIDVSALDTGLLGHSYYGDNRSVVSDLYSLINTGEPPARRFGLRSETIRQKDFWRFHP